MSFLKVDHETSHSWTSIEIDLPRNTFKKSGLVNLKADDSEMLIFGGEQDI